MGSDLDPLAPEEAVELYMDARQDDLTEGTLGGQQYRLEAFVQFCREEGIENLNHLTGRDCYAYRVWRREGKGDGRSPIKKVTLRGQLSTLRAFLGFAEDVDAVEPGLRESVPLPQVTGAENVSDSTLEADRVEAILAHLDRYKYASREHTVLLLGWHTGARLGGLRALDLDDCDLDANHPRLDGPAVHFVHRPGNDTPLKNKDKGERWNRINEHVAQVVKDHIDGPRPDVLDENGREPLFATEYGRAARSTIRDCLYRVTRPCWRGAECPHDRDPDECEATDMQKASQCPSSRSPHDLRSGRVTYYRRNDVPRRIVKDRLNASEDILDEHYDRRSEREKATQRFDYLPDT